MTELTKNSIMTIPYPIDIPKGIYIYKNRSVIGKTLSDKIVMDMYTKVSSRPQSAFPFIITHSFVIII